MKPRLKSVLQAVALVVAIPAAFLSLQIVAVIIADSPRRNFQKNLKQRATAEELHAWATQILAPYQTNQDLSLFVEITNVPAAFHGLQKRKPPACVYYNSYPWSSETDPVAYMKITYGSAAGHYGVIFNPTNLPAPPDREHVVRYTTWVPGVWFFDGQ